jgi:hypothetical protein
VCLIVINDALNLKQSVFIQRIGNREERHECDESKQLINYSGEKSQNPCPAEPLMLLPPDFLISV